MFDVLPGLDRAGWGDELPLPVAQAEDEWEDDEEEEDWDEDDWDDEDWDDEDEDWDDEWEEEEPEEEELRFRRPPRDWD